MRSELTEVGFSELKTSDEVDNLLSKKGTILLVINSVCGCAAGNARPGVINAIKQTNCPEYLATVFAGVDKEAVAKAREYLLPFPPSSPCIALFKNGELVHMIERHHIEGRNPNDISENLVSAFNEFCT
jgi:putative YphP/YqiW family bacilliredoxin